MRIMVQSLKRLYAAGTVTDEKLHSMVDNKVITDAEYAFIVG